MTSEFLKQKKQISATCTMDTVTRVDYWVDEEKRSFSTMVEILLKEALNARDKAANLGKKNKSK